jgi:hypothetical protein
MITREFDTPFRHKFSHKRVASKLQIIGTTNHTLRGFRHYLELQRVLHKILRGCLCDDAKGGQSANGNAARRVCAAMGSARFDAAREALDGIDEMSAAAIGGEPPYRGV